MRGRKPKDPKVRQRRNKPATAATLNASPVQPEEDQTTPTTAPQRAPPMPSGIKWHKEARAMWRDIWLSDMAKQWLPSDRHGLRRLIVLVNRFWVGVDAGMKPNVLTGLAAEIRQQILPYGLTPTDRNRLGWKSAPEDRPRSATAHEMREAGEDPRQALKAVQ